MTKKERSSYLNNILTAFGLVTMINKFQTIIEEIKKSPSITKPALTALLNF